MAQGQDQSQSVPSTTQQVKADIARALAPIQAAGAQDTQTAPAGKPFDPYAATQAYKEAVAAAQSVPGANVPLMAKPVPAARQPIEPMMMPFQSTHVQPTDTSLYARRMANQQSIGNMLGNALTMVGNVKMQKDYENKKYTIQTYADAKTRLAEAQRIIKLYPNDPEAQKVINDNTSIINRIENDNKQMKIIKDAYPDYTDPGKQDPVDAKAYNDAITGVIDSRHAEEAVSQKAQAAQQGIPYNTPPWTQQRTAMPALTRPNADWAGAQGAAPTPGRVQLQTPPPVVTEKAAKEAALQRIPPPPPKQSINFPTELQTTPEYSAMMAREQKIEDAYLNKFLPEAEKAGADIYKTQIQQEGQTQRRFMQDQTEIAKKYIDAIRAADVQDARGQVELKKQAMAGASAERVAQIRTGAIMALLGTDPRMAPFVGALTGKYTKENTTQIEQLTRANKTADDEILRLEGSLANDPTHPGHKIPKGPERDQIEERIKQLNASKSMNQDRIRGLQKSNADLQNLIPTAGGAGQAARAGGEGGAPSPAGFQVPPGTSSGYLRGVQGLLNTPNNPAAWQQMTKSFEGFRPTAYKDASGKGMDIGYGHFITGKEKGMASEITPQQAEQFFQQDYADAQNKVVNALGQNTANQIPSVAGAVLTDYMYQHGHFSKELTAAIQAGDWNKAADIVQKSDTAGGKTIPALTQRFGLTSQVLRALAGGGGTVAGGRTDSAVNQGATAGQNTGADITGAIPADQVAAANAAIRDAFGQDLYNYNVPVVPTTQYPAEPPDTTTESGGTDTETDNDGG
jgi:GH24 family phage-related lysozyme (muramidase)